MKQYIKKTTLLCMLCFGLSSVLSCLYARGGSGEYNPGTGGNPTPTPTDPLVPTYIYYDLRTSVRKATDDPVPAIMVCKYNNRTYTKINVDLNEGAGGRRIFLFYTTTTNKSEALGAAYAQYTTLDPGPGYKTGRSFANDGWTNLNQLAGGRIVKLVGVDPLRTQLHLGLTTNVVTTKIKIIKPGHTFDGGKGTYSDNEGLWYVHALLNENPVNLNASAGGTILYVVTKHVAY